MKKRVVYFQNYEEDVVTSKNQDYKLKDNYKWISNNIFYRFTSFLCHMFFLIIAYFYCKFILHVTIKNKKVLKGYKGYFLYANHTQELGDVLDPILISFPIHPYFVCSPANLGVPVIGKILPNAGALPIPDSIKGLIKLKEGITHKIKHNKCVVIYPEAHVWPYYAKIREFPNTSFHFPYENNAPVFVATTTYQKSKIFKKPKITIYIDGPYKVDDKLSKKENIQKLHDMVYNIMQERSKLSNIEYIKYIKKGE